MDIRDWIHGPSLRKSQTKLLPIMASGLTRPTRETGIVRTCRTKRTSHTPPLPRLQAVRRPLARRRAGALGRCSLEGGSSPKALVRNEVGCDTNEDDHRVSVYLQLRLCLQDDSYARTEVMFHQSTSKLYTPISEAFLPASQVRPSEDLASPQSGVSTL